MPKIIVTSSFRKGGSGKKGAGGLLKYIGTREGVEKLPLDTSRKPATKRQQALIDSIMKKLPDTAQYPEYQLYQELATRSSATDFLNAVMEQEDQAENIGKLVTYMAERPGAVKLGKHGLFSQTNDPIDLEAAAEEVSNHPGYIWTHIVSLRREDAERLGYNNADAWKSLVRRNVTSIAQAHKIPLSDLQWYAAFHNTGHHPHIHLMVYSKGQEGYLSKQSIDSMRSSFGNDIFRQEQYHLFQLQASLRQEVKAAVEQRLHELISAAGSDPQPAAEMHILLTKLRRQLDGYQGKKVYGYLPKSIKATVNEIVSLLASEPNIGKLYDVWNQINREKLSLYYENKDPTVPLVDNKDFRSIKNMIVRAALEMELDTEQVVETKERSASIESQIDSDTDTADSSTQTEEVRTVIRYKEPTVRQTTAAANGLISALARMIGGKCMAHRQVLQGQIDSKLRQKINQKKQALGIRTERTQQSTYHLSQEEYEMTM